MKVTTDMFKEKILKHVKRELKEQKLSQAELGSLIGVSRENVNKILNGTDNGVSLQKILDMAKALNLKVDINITKGNEK